MNNVQEVINRLDWAKMIFIQPKCECIPDIEHVCQQCFLTETINQSQKLILNQNNQIKKLEKDLSEVNFDFEENNMENTILWIVMFLTFSTICLLFINNIQFLKQ